MYLTKEFGAREQGAPMGSATSTLLTDELDAAQIRIVKVGETVVQDAFLWWPLAFPNCQLCACSESYIANISPSRDPYDVLVVAGSDAKRLVKLLRCYLPVLGLVPKIAALEKSTPPERARLLNAGFDDVLTAGVPVHEARARVMAIWQRYQMRSVSLPPSSRGGTRGEKLPALSKGPLTKREADIFRSLLEKSPSPVPLPELQAGLSFARPIKTTSLRVQISTLRKKLKDGAHIQKMTTGYALIVDRGAR